MKKLILPLCFGFVLASCSRDNHSEEFVNNPKTTTQEIPVLLTKVVNVEENGDVEISTYEYDGDKVLKFTSGYENGWSRSNISNYTGDLVSSIISTENNGEKETTNFTYNSKNKIEKSVSVNVVKLNDGNGNVVTTTNVKNYTYNAGGIVVVNESNKTEYSIDSQFNMVGNAKYTYTIQNDLIVKLVKENEDGVTTITYRYDDKNAPMKNIKGVSAVIYEMFDGGAIGTLKNNVVFSQVVRVSKHDGTTVTSTNEYAYEYNAKGYPIKVTSTHKSSDSSQTSTETYKFTYNK
ncbi:MAG: hypothetical protein ACFNQA_03050 [Flavobacteriaceae bacterium]